MENLHHTLWIVEFVNRLLGPLVASLLGKPYAPGTEIIPDYLVMCGVIVLLVTVFSLAVRSTFSVDNPGKLQIVLEDIVGFLNGLLKENIGPAGTKFLPLVGSIFIFIFLFLFQFLFLFLHEPSGLLLLFVDLGVVRSKLIWKAALLCTSSC